jgi:hypothetical protein
MLNKSKSRRAYVAITDKWEISSVSFTFWSLLQALHIAIHSAR